MIIKGIDTEYMLEDFIDGQRDCKEGKPADAERSFYYQRGYACQYEQEQVGDVLYGH